MAFLDIFKKKKLQERKVKPKAEEEKAKRASSSSLPPSSRKRDSVKEEKAKRTASSSSPSSRKRDSVKKETKTGQGYQTLKTPRVSEKAADLAEKNQYVFEVYPRANKTEIKKSIEGLYGVDAISVRIINVPRKKRRLGKIEGFRKGYKKAIIKIKEGQKIEVLPR